MRHLICALLCAIYATLAVAALDLNSASVAELDALPGVGPSRAQAIVDYRAAHGPFRALDELARVKGIGDKTLAELRPLLTVVQEERTSAAPAVVADDAAKASGFPWGLLLIGGAVAAAVVFMFLRRRKAVTVVPPAQMQPVPAPEAPPSRSAAPGTPLRPPSLAPRSGSGAAAPPRPAGSAPVVPADDAAASASATQPPRPAGAPPKPAGSR
ncbi:MAG: helix-hairpin-helix domain-containing protein [Gammaproteobacteria bacterium]|jgi:competence protein ComEA|nr:helix-hairpin-helix domain-containing protein [Gammaproteobacteria bacterium]MBU1848822.1 helix-hairpin-helix domain-containing protein [Gammaproteobacteria bacterium]